MGNGNPNHFFGMERYKRQHLQKVCFNGISKKQAGYVVNMESSLIEPFTSSFEQTLLVGCFVTFVILALGFFVMPDNTYFKGQSSGSGNKQKSGQGERVLSGWGKSEI